MSSLQTHRGSGLLLFVAFLLLTGIWLWQNAGTQFFLPVGDTEPAQLHYIVAENVRLDINLATAEELAELPAIGDVLAARIVEYREQNGPFASAGDIREVYGIGDGIYSTIQDLITVSDSE